MEVDRPNPTSTAERPVRPTPTAEYGNRRDVSSSRVVDNALLPIRAAIVKGSRFLQADEFGEIFSVNEQADVSKQEPVPQGRRIAARAQSRADEGALASPILLHGAFAAERLMLWGERRATLSEPRGTPPHTPLDQHRFASSPYDAGREALLAAIEQAVLPQGVTRSAAWPHCGCPRSTIGRKRRVRWSPSSPRTAIA